MSDREQRRLHDLFLQYKSGVVPVEVVDANGDAGIGTAFHLGESVFLTARHVVEGNRRTRVLGEDVSEFKFHTDPEIDIAAFRLSQETNSRAALPLGSHLDDWIVDDDFVLCRAVMELRSHPPIV